SERQIQVRDADGSRLLEIRMAPDTITVHLSLQRNRPDRVLFAQTLVPRLLTGWPDQQTDRVFAQIVERFAGMNRPGAARLIGADGTFTAELSGTRGSRALDITVSGDAGNLALYFDEETAGPPSAPRRSDDSVPPGASSGTADSPLPAGPERVAVSDPTGVEHSAPQQDSTDPVIGDLPEWIGDRATAAWVDVDTHTANSGPFNCAPLVQWFVRDAVGGDAAAAMNPAAVDDPLIAMAGMHKLDLVSGLGTGWAERPVGTGTAGLAAMVAQVHHSGGTLVGAVDPPGSGLGHCFAVTTVTAEFAAILNALPVALRGEVEVRTGELVVFDNAAGGLLRGRAIYDWVVSGWAGSADVHVAGFDAAGTAHEEFVLEQQVRRGPAGRLGALQRRVRTQPWGERTGSQPELDRAGAKLAALLGIGVEDVQREHLHEALQLLRQEFDYLDDDGWARAAAGRAPRLLPRLLGRFLTDRQALETTVSDPWKRQFKAGRLHENFADKVAGVLDTPEDGFANRSAPGQRPDLRRLARQSGDPVFGELAEAVDSYQDLADGLSASTPAHLHRRHSTDVEGFGQLDDSAARAVIGTAHDLLERFPVPVAGITVTRRSGESALDDDTVSSVADAECGGYEIGSTRLKLTIPAGRSVTDDEVRAAVVAGIGKALVVAGRWRAERHAPQVLREYYRDTHGDPESAQFTAWLRGQFPASCFYGDHFLPGPA
ncbi:MAG: hypothetical protein HOQ36_17630, partial [Nocardia sp.]|nr:hypothetical protein [Nocardia sp.]